MRLLRLTAQDEFELTTFIDEESLPSYAILSHTWIEGQEVIYDELITGIGKEKAGYDKLRFCGERAAQDDLQYFWVDTCCTIQTHHRRQRPTKRVGYAAENGGITHIAFPYKIRIIYPHSL
jgi:hypothetical protein